MKTKTSATTNLIDLSPCRRGLLLIAFAGALFTLSPQARATCQDACLTNDNTVQGNDALISLTTGFNNTAIGSDALTANTGGVQNTATGEGALANNTTGSNNTATGGGALVFNATGDNNTATGLLALQSTTGSNNTGTGVFALLNNTSGSNNIALGDSAGINLTSGSHNIYIGNAGGDGGESRRIRIGTVGTQTATFIAGISGVTVPDGVGVIVGNNGKLGTVVSSERFKAEIKPMDKVSESILALKPVTFRYKRQFDPNGVPQFGLVAEQVEKVNPDLVARDKEGEPYTVRYEAVNAMLLNEFLKEHRKVEQMQKQIEALTAGLQKVSAQLEARRGAQQTLVSNP